MQLSTPSITVLDHNTITLAPCYLTDSASIWWFNLENSLSTSNSWEGFKFPIAVEFVPADHARRARDKSCKLKQEGSIKKYLSDFQNALLMIIAMKEGKKLDIFIEGSNKSVKVKIMKSGCSQFEDCARMALSVDSAKWEVSRTLGSLKTPRSNFISGPTSMNTGSGNGFTSSDVRR